MKKFILLAAAALSLAAPVAGFAQEEQATEATEETTEATTKSTTEADTEESTEAPTEETTKVTAPAEDELGVVPKTEIAPFEDDKPANPAADAPVIDDGPAPKHEVIE